MDCKDVGRMLSAWVLGELDEAEAARVSEHVSTCERCRAEAEETRRLVGEIEDGLAGGELRPREGLRERILAEAASLVCKPGRQKRPSSRIIRAAVRRRLGRRRHARRRRSALFSYVLPSLAAAAVLLLFVNFAARRLREPGRELCAAVVGVEGDVQLIRGSEKTLARVGRLIKPGHEVVAGTGASLRFRYPDGTTVGVAGGTGLSLVARAGGKRIHLSQGELHAEVSRQPAGRPMVLTTPHAEATVLGTRFSLTAEIESTRLEVVEGQVRLASQHEGTSVEVAAGHYALVARGVPLEARPISAVAAPILIELEDFGTARGVEEADGAVKRLFLERLAGSHGGACVAAPGVGTEVSGTVSLPEGRWHLWVRYRDDDRGVATFEVLADGRLLGSVAGRGDNKRWHWKRLAFRSGGRVRITLRSTYEGKLDSRTGRGDLNPYDVVNRWDRLCLVQDPNYAPPDE